MGLFLSRTRWGQKNVSPSVTGPFQLMTRSVACATVVHDAGRGGPAVDVIDDGRERLCTDGKRVQLLYRFSSPIFPVLRSYNRDMYIDIRFIGSINDLLFWL